MQNPLEFQGLRRRRRIRLLELRNQRRNNWCIWPDLMMARTSIWNCSLDLKSWDHHQCQDTSDKSHNERKNNGWSRDSAPMGKAVSGTIQSVRHSQRTRFYSS